MIQLGGGGTFQSQPTRKMLSHQRDTLEDTGDLAPSFLPLPGCQEVTDLPQSPHPHWPKETGPSGHILEEVSQMNLCSFLLSGIFPRYLPPKADKCNLQPWTVFDGSNEWLLVAYVLITLFFFYLRMYLHL